MLLKMNSVVVVSSWLGSTRAGHATSCFTKIDFVPLQGLSDMVECGLVRTLFQENRESF